MPRHLNAATALTGLEAGASAEQSIRVVLADDHALMRRHLCLLLDGEESVEVVAEADDLAAVVRHVVSHRPDVLVIDLSLSNGSSIETIRELRQRVPGTAIVVLTMQESPVFAREALDAGAIGFVIKHAADAELAQGVRDAARGEEYVSPRVVARRDPARRSPTDGGLSEG